MSLIHSDVIINVASPIESWKIPARDSTLQLDQWIIWEDQHFSQKWHQFRDTNFEWHPGWSISTVLFWNQSQREFFLRVHPSTSESLAHLGKSSNQTYDLTDWCDCYHLPNKLGLGQFTFKNRLVGSLELEFGRILPNLPDVNLFKAPIH